MAQQIALFGKGGVGKTTIAANLAAALAESDHRVLLVGLSPTADTSHLLLNGEELAHFQDLVLERVPVWERSIVSGYRGTGCIEVGDVYQTGICTSNSIAETLGKLRQSGVTAAFAADFVLYDIPGDISCSGPALFQDIPIQTALLVASADFQSMFAANRYAELVNALLPTAAVALVANGNAGSFEDSLVADYARKTGLSLAATIPRSLVVRHSELYGKTVIEAAPLSSHAYAYRRLARLIAEGGLTPGVGTIEALSGTDLKAWARGWGERLGELEFGIIQDGAGI